MGGILSKREKADYRHLKSLIAQSNHKVDKAAIRSLTKHMSKENYSLPNNLTAAEWDRVGRKLWAAANRNDKNAMQAIMAWTTVQTILEADQDAGIQGAPGSDQLGSCGRSARMASGHQNALTNSALPTNSGAITNTVTTTICTSPPVCAPRSQNGGKPDEGTPQNVIRGEGEEASNAYPLFLTLGGEGPSSSRGGPYDPLHQAPPLGPSHLPVKDGSTHGLGPSHEPTALPPINPFGPFPTAPSTNPFKTTPDTTDLSVACHQPAHLSRMERAALQAKDLNELQAVQAFPVFFDGANQPHWEPLPIPLIKDTKKAVAEYGLSLAYAMGVIGALLQAFTFTTNDLKDLARTLLNNMEITMFLDTWYANVHKYAHETAGVTNRPVPDTIEMLFGIGK
ncbi:hypothetical protein WISP_17415 [Willisornis vidua]|uniref:Uncharacterized protein n=1 Tax=Willisornis vidua TaxID=1566151 RepID=A0ABQ9DPF9_9PASS|nr:hypothetical protein WISP_17415 [Willisornis vidua]